MKEKKKTHNILFYPNTSWSNQYFRYHTINNYRDIFRSMALSHLYRKNYEDQFPWHLFICWNCQNSFQITLLFFKRKSKYLKSHLEIRKESNQWHFIAHISWKGLHFTLRQHRLQEIMLERIGSQVMYAVYLKLVKQQDIKEEHMLYFNIMTHLNSWTRSKRNSVVKCRRMPLLDNNM